MGVPNTSRPPTDSHATPDYVNEVHFAFLDGANDAPIATTPGNSTPSPLTPSLRDVQPSTVTSPLSVPSSVFDLLRILVFLVLLGVIPSTIVFVVDISVHYIFLAREDTLKPAHGIPGILLYVSSGVALCLASTFVCHVFSLEAEGSGIPSMKSIMSGFYDRQKPALSLWALLAKTTGLVCAIGGGLPVGWEGPNVHISCIVAHHLSRLPPFRFLRRDRALRMQVMACACAVGLASSFGTPIGGVLYALETTASFYLVPTFWKSVWATLAGSFVYDLLYKTPIVQAFQNTTFEAGDFTGDELFFFTLLGALLGLLGAFFVRCVHTVYILRKTRLQAFNRYILLAAVGITAALVQYPHYQLRLDPRRAINEFFSSDNMETLSRLDVLSLVLIKFPLVIVAIGLPIPAGVFIPCFLLGSGLGRLYGEILRALFGSDIVPGGYAVVGAAAFTAGVTRAFSVAVVIFEVTGQLKHMLPTLAAVVIAVVVGNGINRSLYDTLIIMKELPYMPHMRRDRAPAQKVREVMRTDVIALREVSTLGEIRAILDMYTSFDSFPVVASERLFLGSVRRKTLIALMSRSSISNHADVSVDLQPLTHNSKAMSDLRKDLPSSKDQVPSTDGVSLSIAKISGDLGDDENNGDSMDDGDDMSGDGDQQETYISELEQPNGGGQYGEDTRVRLRPDLSPLVVTANTSLSQLHFMFVMLMPTHAYVLQDGRLYGVITRGDIVQSGEFVHLPRVRHRHRRGIL